MPPIGLFSVARRPILLSLFLLVMAGGCATPGGAVGPLPFPGATPPPAPLISAVRPAPPAPDAPSADALVETALSLRGIPYVFGGENPQTGFDCSGLVQFVFARYSVEVPRTVGAQFRIGLPVTLADLRAGDLVFFSTTGPGPTHVGIALNHEQFIHAPNSNGVVRVEPVDSPYWHERFVGARRVW